VIFYDDLFFRFFSPIVLLHIKMNAGISDHIELEMNGDSGANEFPSISEEVTNAYFKMYFESLISYLYLFF
jgi:hypothetical protein